MLDNLGEELANLELFGQLAHFLHERLGCVCGVHPYVLDVAHDDKMYCIRRDVELEGFVCGLVIFDHDNVSADAFLDLADENSLDELEKLVRDGIPLFNPYWERYRKRITTI